MNIEEYREYCLSIKGVTESFPFDEHTLVYKIMDKMFTFAPLNPKGGRFWADTKCDTARSAELINHSIEEVVKKLPKKKQEEYYTTLK